MLMSYYVNVAEKQNLTSPCVSVQYHVTLSGKVELCRASHPGQREGWLRVIFTVSLKVIVCVFTFVQITGSKSCKQCLLHAEVTFSLFL
jgi:hypothetical protein